MKNRSKIPIFLVIAILGFSVFLLSACSKQSEENIEFIESEENYIAEEDVEEDYNIDEEFEEEYEEEADVSGLISKTGMLRGIIFEVRQYLFAVDPDSGEITAFRDFTPKDEEVTLMNSAGNNAFQYLQYYNKDLTKRFAYKDETIPNHGGSYRHIGWVNTDGEFEDITAQLESFDNEDSYTAAPDPIDMHRARNYRDTFIYAQSKNKGVTYRFPINEFTPGKYETYGYEIGEWTGGDTTNISPVGTLVGLGSDGYYRRLESGEHEYTWPEGHQEIEENATELMDVTKNITLRWTSKDSYIMARDLISDDYSTLYLCQRESETKFKCKAILPYVDGRTNQSYAISPDNQKVAIISTKAKKTDFYIGYVSGSSAPEILEINQDPLYDLELDETVDLLKGKLLYWSYGTSHPQELELKHYLDTPECAYQIKVNAERQNNSDD